MNRLVLFTSLSFLFVACANQKGEKRYLPSQVDKAVYFDMPLSEFKTLKGSNIEKSDDGMDFRKVFLESVNGSLIKYYGYYFDAEDREPLYEVIIGYKDEATVNNEATKLLGPCNYEETEWKFEVKNGYDILAWKFETKLIIAALIPKTEWHEEANPE